MLQSDRGSAWVATEHNLPWSGWLLP